MHLIVGVVAEGPTDLEVLEEYMSAWLEQLDGCIDLEVRPLQPVVDATSGHYGDGGWTWVRTWCTENPPQVRADLFQPMFENERPLNLLLVQLDGDVVGEYASPYPDVTVPDNPDAPTRGTIVEHILAKWLWNSTEQRRSDPHEGRHCLVATVRALETWIVAGLDHSIRNPEEIENPEQVLMNLEPRLRTKLDGGVRRLRKNPQAWLMLAKKTRTELEHIKSVCPQCDKFLTHVGAAINEQV